MTECSTTAGAKTGLTGGSVPRSRCDRPMVVINTQRLQKILPIGSEAKEVLCFAGAGIFSVQEALKLGKVYMEGKVKREPEKQHIDSDKRTFKLV